MRGPFLKALVLSGLALLMLSGCSSLLRQPYPTDQPPATFEGFGHIRYYPGEYATLGQTDLETAYQNEPADAYQTQPDGSVVYNYLAVSGGGSDGAFGAGLLKGWSEFGDRPKFKIVTGVSTGSLIAPLAFLGPEYDGALKEAYTTIDASHIFLVRSMLSLIWQESVTDNKPFEEMIAKYITDDVLNKIAEEHNRGRRLYVATTDLDREVPVIWDMGAIASSTSPDRLAMFRRVLRASASIPAFFPPVLFQVKLDGQNRDELHVDGGVFFQSFFVGNTIDMKQLVALAHPDWTKPNVHRLYVIRNGRLDSQPRTVNRSLGSISAYSIDTMLKVSGINDLYRLYVGDVGGELELQYIAIPHEYVPSTTEEFNQQEMVQEYELGYRMGVGGVPWKRLPPGYRV